MTVNHGVPGSSPGEGAKSHHCRVAFFVGNISLMLYIQSIQTVNPVNLDCNCVKGFAIKILIFVSLSNYEVVFVLLIN